jgi:hypothetical protein
MTLPIAVIHHGDIMDLWPALAAGIAQAAGEGDATILSQLSAVGLQIPANAAIGCLDFPPQLRGYADFSSRLAAARRVAPHTRGATEGWWSVAGCAAWPASKPHPWRATRVTGAPPILIVSSLLDASTPLRWAFGLQRQVAGSGLLFADVVGHTGYLHSACTREAEARYLVTGRLPARGTVCGPSASAASGPPTWAGHFRVTRQLSDEFRPPPGLYG